MREREAARDAAMKQMQSEMHQLVAMLLGKSGLPDYNRSGSKLSVLSNSVVSTQFQVEDDYESDVEDISEGQSLIISSDQFLLSDLPPCPQTRGAGAG